MSAETPLPWIARGSRGWLPFQCYAFSTDAHLILVDGGLAVHRQEIASGLAPLLQGERRRMIMTTRRDVDAIINLPWLLRAFGFERVHFGSGDLSPLDFFAVFDQANAEAQAYALASPVPVEWVEPGKVTAFGPFRFEFLRPKIRVLASNWLYEASTRTLFSSDSFGFLTRSEPIGPLVETRAAELTTDRIVGFLNAKFDWLCGIDSSVIAHELSALLGERPIERVCPSYGCVIEGKAAVELLFSRTVEALAILSKRPKPSLFADFDWSRYPDLTTP